MLSTQSELLTESPVSTDRERFAYEAYWARKETTFKKAALALQGMPIAQPSQLVSEAEIDRVKDTLDHCLSKSKIDHFQFALRGAVGDYPTGLSDAEHPVQALYYQGDWSLTQAPHRIAIIGSRSVSRVGIARARRLVRLLVANKFVILSGLAEGVDTTAHTEAIKQGGKTIAVIGTPITDVYPKANSQLQQEIARNHLLISQIPIVRYTQQDYRLNRQYFPERNATMSALAQGTVIVEAADRSGTLTQAKAVLKQGRKLFILNSCFENTALSWPQHYEGLGAIRVKAISDITDVLPNK